MNKKDLIQVIQSKRPWMSKLEINESITMVFDAIKETLETGEEVRITGFGRFKRTLRKAYDAHNPSTMEKIRVAARWTVSFKPSDAVKEIVK